MDSVPSEDYAHRKNEDGTFDSICMFCFRTIASAGNESELATKSVIHVHLRLLAAKCKIRATKKTSHLC